MGQTYDTTPPTLVSITQTESSLTNASTVHYTVTFSEPVTGRLTIRAEHGLKVYRQHGLARDAREIFARYENGRYRIELDRSIATYWLILK